MGCKDRLPWQDERDHDGEKCQTDAKVQVTEDIREWDYGDYEGLTSPQIRERREKEGLGPNWNIWTDGCPGGEYV